MFPDKTDIDIREFQGYLSASDVQTLFNDGGFYQRAIALFFGYNEMDEFKDNIKGLNVVDPTGMKMSNEEIAYRRDVGVQVADLIRQAAKNKRIKLRTRASGIGCGAFLRDEGYHDSNRRSAKSGR